MVVLHARLESTEPVEGDTISVYPSVMRLVFSEPIEDEFAELTLSDGHGVVTRLKPRIDPHDVKALIGDFPALPPGGYLVVWRVVSADGHPVGGHFVFYVAVGPPGSSKADLLVGTLPPPAPPQDHAADAAAGMSGEPPILAAITRGAALGSLMALTGLLVVATFWVPVRSNTIASLEKWLAIATPLLLTADFLLWLQHAASATGVDIDSIVMSLSTQNGGIYAARVGLAAIAAWALLLVRRPGLAAVFTSAAILVTSATGHPAAIRASIAIPGKAVHLAGVSLWLGGLLVLVLDRRPREEYTAGAHRVSNLALIAVGAVALTGVIETLLFLPKLGDVLTSAYGRMVLGKLTGLLGLVAFGAWHRYRAVPRIVTGGTPDAMRRSVAWETGLMAAVVVLASFLAYIPPPSAGGGDMMHLHSVPAATEDP